MPSLSLAVSQTKCWQFPFVSPKMMLKLKLVVSPWPTILDFLYMFTSSLPKLAITATIRRSHRELAIEGRCVWVRCAERWGCLWASWADLWPRCLQQLVSELFDGVHNTAGFLSLKCPLWVLSATFPGSSHPQSLFSDSVLWMGWKRNEHLWQHSWARRSLSKLCFLGRGVMWVKSNFPSYPLQCVQIHCFL